MSQAQVLAAVDSGFNWLASVGSRCK